MYNKKDSIAPKSCCELLYSKDLFTRDHLTISAVDTNVIVLYVHGRVSSFNKNGQDLLIIGFGYCQCGVMGQNVIQLAGINFHFTCIFYGRYLKSPTLICLYVLLKIMSKQSVFTVCFFVITTIFLSNATAI